MNELLTLHEIKLRVALGRVKRFGGDKRAAARSLDISLKTLYGYLDAHTNSREVATATGLDRRNA